MKKYCEIKTTFKSKTRARKIAKILLLEKLVACTQISMIESIYRWDDKIVNEKEFLLTLKTTKNLYKEVEKIIVINHPYQVPQIIVLSIEDGLDSYFGWIDKTLRQS